MSKHCSCISWPLECPTVYPNAERKYSSHTHEPFLSVACSQIIRPSQLFQFQNETKFQWKKELHVTVCKCCKSFWDIKHQSSYNTGAVGKTKVHGEFDRWQKDSLALVQSSRFQGLETWKLHGKKLPTTNL